MNDNIELGALNKVAHANFCKRCLYGLPSEMAEADSARVAIGFYCLGALDILGLLDTKISNEDREAWRVWIWSQQVKRPGRVNEGAGMDITFRNDNRDTKAVHIGGFRPGPFMHVEFNESEAQATHALDADLPHLIMTYTALLSLAILRDDFSQLDRQGLIGLLRATQKDDGSFSAVPGQGEADIRMVYTAFAICAMLDDWTGVDVSRALAFARGCMSYEGGFGQAPGNEAQGERSVSSFHFPSMPFSPENDFPGEAQYYHALQQLIARSSYLALMLITSLIHKLLSSPCPESGFVDPALYPFILGSLSFYLRGPTYCALATLALAPETHCAEATLSKEERKRTERWLVQQQQALYVLEETGEGTSGKEGEVEGGGFSGRTEKEGDACYSFWCGAALRILRSGALGGQDSSTMSSPDSSKRYPQAQSHDIESTSSPRPSSLDNDFERQRQDEESDFVERLTHARFLSRCQFRLGGLAKAPGAHPDPYHTYLALAALALYPPYPSNSSSSLPPDSRHDTEGDGKLKRERESWNLARLDPLINASVETARWACERISGKVSPTE
ncbi:terpenoid cyclases/Protein prenyltransferase [Fomitiporia mediterranea MF3/22]|uniref:terpenoid cyclases/Protein prenyltransferase n=1 Tax=Fomitiporia mediterranea (strain MF3/22) TaxID=694068 RepID=UPI0004407415|nr:terpenoid cyclases/Protein prenyltransferase [Fomitiporia mediterranea MF3/22]EJC98499.1 terpenoid cyclases/Protein prenyltransferase [Fomitiporia mediterranea MF3/22]